MKYNHKYLPLLLLSTLMLLGSCGARKKAKPTEDPTNDTVYQATNIDYSKAIAYTKSHPSYASFQGVAQANYKSKNDQQTVDLQIKSKHEEATYFNVRAGALGITMEAAAGLATKDSLTVVNRIERVYYAMSYDEAAKLIHAPLDFQSIQNLFTARPLLTTGDITHQGFEDGKAIITMEADGFIQTLHYNEATKHLEKLELQNTAQQFHCTILYQDYRTYSNVYTFPYHQIITANYRGQLITLELKYKEITFNTTPYYDLKIPKSYDKRKL